MGLRLETDRLFLRPIELQDVSVRYDVLCDPGECNVIGTDHYEAPDHLEAVVMAYQKMDHIHHARHWTVVLKGTGTAIGFCDIYLPGLHLQRSGICEVSYGLCRDYRGYGFMFEALQCCLYYAIEKDRLFRIEATVNQANRDSVKLLERIGFKFEGIQRKKLIWSSQRHDMLGYALLADEMRFAR